jgi:hypothetical protein
LEDETVGECSMQGRVEKFIKDFDKNSEGGIPPRKPRCRQKDNIEMDL